MGVSKKKEGGAMADVSYELNVLPFLAAVEGWTREGLAKEQIARNLGVGKTTFFKYIKLHPELDERLKKGLEVANFEVENALFKRAIGYSYTETKIETSAEGIKETRTEKHVAGDVGAQAFWLKNKKSAHWKDRVPESNEKDLEVLDALLSKIDAVMQPKGEPNEE